MDDHFDRMQAAVDGLAVLEDDVAVSVDEATKPEPFLVTKEHRRFAEFADACRRHRYIGVCHGPPGVGKTQSARRYAGWDQLEPLLLRWRRNIAAGLDRDEWHTVFYTPTLTVTPRTIDRDLRELGSALAVLRADDPLDHRARNPRHGSPHFVELLIVDEADRLKTAAIEQLRDHFDRSRLGLILIGMPGIEKRLSRYPQLYSRIGFVHQYRPLSPDEQAHVIARHWPHLGLVDREDFTVAEAIAAIARITGGNFRLTSRLVAQIERILEINQLRTVTKEVVEAARQSLVIGSL